jgi:hypothetical protein
MSSVLGRGVDRAVAFWVGEKGEAGHLDISAWRAQEGGARQRQSRRRRADRWRRGLNQLDEGDDTVRQLGLKGQAGLDWKLRPARRKQE